MVRANRRPKAVAAAKPTTARIHTALELPLSMDGLHDLKQNFKGSVKRKLCFFQKRKATTYGNEAMVPNLT